MTDALGSRHVLSDHPAVRLLPRPNALSPYESSQPDAPWRLGHLAAVRGYLNDRWSAFAEETALLSLLDGLDSYIENATDEWTDDRAYEFVPSLYAAASLLNYERKRLDGGTLDRWLGTMFDRIGWNRDLNRPADAVSDGAEVADA